MFVGEKRAMDKNAFKPVLQTSCLQSYFQRKTSLNRELNYLRMNHRFERIIFSLYEF